MSLTTMALPSVHSDLCARATAMPLLSHPNACVVPSAASCESREVMTFTPVHPHQPRERVQRALPPQGHTTAGRARARCSMHATRRHRRARPRAAATCRLFTSRFWRWSAESQRSISLSASVGELATHPRPRSDRRTRLLHCRVLLRSLPPCREVINRWTPRRCLRLRE
jgi:hypothetical protein